MGKRFRGALLSIDAIATNGTIAGSIRQAGADNLLAAKAHQPISRTDIEICFDDAPAAPVDTLTDTRQRP